MTKSAGRTRRLTRHINKPVTQSIFRAFDFARDSGKPFNLYVVINLRDDMVMGAAEAFSQIVHKFRDWLTYKNRKSADQTPPIYSHSFENPNGHMHVNWVVHVPDALRAEFEKKLFVWVERVQGFRKFDINIQPVRVDYYKRLAKYVVKGTDERFIKHFYLDDVYDGSQGEVWGRRAGVSQAVGIQARKRAQYHPGRRRPYVPARPQGGGPIHAGGVPPDMNRAEVQSGVAYNGPSIL